MDIDFLGLHDIQIKGYMAVLTYLNGKQVRFDFDDDTQREEFVKEVESYMQSLGNIYTFNPN